MRCAAAAKPRGSFFLYVRAPKAAVRNGRRTACLGAELGGPLASSDRVPLLLLRDFCFAGTHAFEGTVSAFAAGQSLGEYSALCATRALSLAETARLLKLRGQSMQQSVPNGKGAMAAILGLEDEKVEVAQHEEADQPDDDDDVRRPERARRGEAHRHGEHDHAHPGIEVHDAHPASRPRHPLRVISSYTREAAITFFETPIGIGIQLAGPNPGDAKRSERRRDRRRGE